MTQLLDFDNCSGREFPCPYCREDSANLSPVCVNAVDFGAAIWEAVQDAEDDRRNLHIMRGGNYGDLVNHPPHYNQGKYETIDVIEDADLGYHLSAALKYILRCKWKQHEIEDLRKAVWYIERYISRAEEMH